MLLSYKIPCEKGGTRRSVTAMLMTEHPASQAGQPVIVLPNGAVLDRLSWAASDYRIEMMSPTEEQHVRAMGLDDHIVIHAPLLHIPRHSGHNSGS